MTRREIEARQGQDPKGLDRNDESSCGEADAPTLRASPQELLAKARVIVADEVADCETTPEDAELMVQGAIAALTALQSKPTEDAVPGSDEWLKQSPNFHGGDIA